MKKEFSNLRSEMSTNCKAIAPGPRGDVLFDYRRNASVLELVQRSSLFSANKLRLGFLSQTLGKLFCERKPSLVRRLFQVDADEEDERLAKKEHFLEDQLQGFLREHPLYKRLFRPSRKKNSSADRFEVLDKYADKVIRNIGQHPQKVLDYCLTSEANSLSYVQVVGVLVRQKLSVSEDEALICRAIFEEYLEQLDIWRRLEANCL